MSFHIMQINFEHVTVRKNKNGSVRYYFRRRGQPVTRLPDDPKSAEFGKMYARLLERPVYQGRYQSGTFGWACEAYLASGAFKSKSEATRLARERIIKTLMIEPVDPSFPEKYGHEKLSDIDADYIEVLRDRKAEFPNAANERLKILNQIFKPLKMKKIMDHNPVDGVERLAVVSDGHKTATDDDISQYLAYHRTGTAHTAMLILMTFGMRVSDLRLIGRKNVKNGTLSFVTKKTNMLCELPVPDNFKFPNEMFFVLSDSGKPFSSDKTMSDRVSRWFKQAGIEGVTGHGVRKWLATKKAELGWTEMELMAWFGWKDGKEARVYTATANRKKIAANAAARTANV